MIRPSWVFFFAFTNKPSISPTWVLFEFTQGVVFLFRFGVFWDVLYTLPSPGGSLSLKLLSEHLSDDPSWGRGISHALLEKGDLTD